MCQIAHFHDRVCRHRWAQIAVPCAPGMGFNLCPSFCNPFLVKDVMPPTYAVYFELCPVCHLRGGYDRNTIRMIHATKKRWKIGGRGPAVMDGGCEVGCVVM